MTATYTFDIFSTLDGYANHSGDWGGYRSTQGPESLEHCAAIHREPQRVVLGATAYAENATFADPDFDRSQLDEWILRM